MSYRLFDNYFLWGLLLLLPHFYLSRQEKSYFFCLIVLVIGLSAYNLSQYHILESNSCVEKLTIDIEQVKRINRQGKQQCFIQGKLHHQANRVLLMSYQESFMPKVGELWSVKAKLKYPHAKKNFFINDELWEFKSKAIYATGSIIKNSPLLLRESVPGYLDDFKNKMNQYLKSQNIENNTRFILKKLLLNERESGFDNTPFIHTGTMHLLAISGLHIGLIIAILSFFLKKKINNKKIVFFIMMIIVFLYLCLINYPITAVRAACMFFLASSIFLFDGKVDKLKLLLISIILTLSVDFTAIYNRAFYLSYCAVVVIFIYNKWHQKNHGKWVNFIFFNIIMAVGIAPISALFFKSISFSSPVANLFMVPVYTLLVLPMAILSAFIMPFPQPYEISSIIFSMLDFVVHYTTLGLIYLDKFNYSYMELFYDSFIWLVFLFLLCFVFLLPKQIPKASMVICFSMLCFCLRQPIPKNDFVVNILDIGQGLCVLVRTASINVLYDTGPGYADGKMRRIDHNILINELKHFGIDHLDFVVISHNDLDHRGGLQTVLKEFSVGKIYTSRKIKNINSKTCEKFIFHKEDHIIFEFININNKNMKNNNNDASCVLKISNHSHDVLLTGDITRAIEKQLIKEDKKKLSSEILIAPHHGSKTSSSYPFLKAVSPKCVIFSTGFLNQYHHPHPSVINRYASMSIDSYNTAVDGAVSLYCASTLPSCDISVAAKSPYHKYND